MELAKLKIPVAALTLSAAGLFAIVEREGWEPVARVPVPGDPCTGGYGSTTHSDGRPVKCGEVFHPVASLKRTLTWASDADRQFKKVVKVPLSQGEYDLYVDFMYNVGVGAFTTSTLVKRLNAGDYTGACQAILDWRYVRKFDCSTPGNKVCYGLWTARLKQHNTCMELQ